MLRVPLVTILARECDWKFYKVDQRLGMLRVALLTILAREMRLTFFWSWPSFGDVASAARYWREKCDWKRPSFGNVASVASHGNGVRNSIEIFPSQPSFRDVASFASHNIGARNGLVGYATVCRKIFHRATIRRGQFTARQFTECRFHRMRRFSDCTLRRTLFRWVHFSSLSSFRARSRWKRQNMFFFTGELLNPNPFEWARPSFYSTTLAKKIETAARTWHRRVIYQACTRLYVWLACLFQFFWPG